MLILWVKSWEFSKKNLLSAISKNRNNVFNHQRKYNLQLTKMIKNSRKNTVMKNKRNTRLQNEWQIECEPYKAVFKITLYSRTPEIETADFSQSHARLNLSQFQTDCLLRINSSTAILNYFELFKLILGIGTTLTNKKYWYFTLLKIFINWYVMHSLFFINDECITWQF